MAKKFVLSEKQMIQFAKNCQGLGSFNLEVMFFLEKNGGFWGSFSEFAETFGRPRGNVSKSLVALEQRGVLKIDREERAGRRPMVGCRLADNWIDNVINM